MCGIYHVGRELESGVESMMRMVNRERKAQRRTAFSENMEEKGESALREVLAGESRKSATREIFAEDCRKIDLCGFFTQERDIRPTDQAPVLVGREDGMILQSVRWGLPGFQKGQVIFNARCETAMEKPMFRDGILRSRIVIPAVSFYEWNKLKEKNVFKRPDGKVIYMAGFCRGEGEMERFTILTTAANASMQPVHDRMPLILEESEIEPWLYQENWTESLLRKVPGALSREAEFEQLSLF